MRFLCLGYGDEAGWQSLSPEEQADALAHDEVIRERGALMSPVESGVAIVTNGSGGLDVTRSSGLDGEALPLAGFSVIEAASLDEVVALVSNTPCPRAGGRIEIRPFLGQGDTQAIGADGDV